MLLHALQGEDARTQAAARGNGRDGLPFFPWHYEDEHLYSLVARYTRYSQSFPSWVREELFGSGAYFMALEAPTSIGAFCSAVGTGELSDATFVIRNLTPFNYMVAYREGEDRKAFFDKMVADPMRGSAGRISRGALVPRVRGLRYCASCLREDLRKYLVGEPYWRRSHQLPSVVVCIRHRIPLLEAGRTATVGRTNFAVPSAGLIDIHTTSAREIDDIAMSMLYELAVKSEHLLNDRVEAKSPALALEGYRAAIRHIGLTWGRRLDFKALVISFKDVMSPVQQFFPFLLASDGYPSWWLKSFLAGGRRVINQPLLHLLVEQWLARASSLREDDSRREILRATRGTTQGSIAGWRTEIRDPIAADQVTDAAQRIRLQVPLTRVTRAKLAGELGISSLESRRPAGKFWPLTSQAITAVEEARDAFFQRRLEYEIEKVAAEGREPRVHLILRRLGRRGRQDYVAQAIAAWKTRSDGTNK